MFSKINTQLQQQFSELCTINTPLFQVEVDRNDLWNIYINALPEEIRQEHNCSACKKFIRNYGNIIAIVNNEIHTLWDFIVAEPYAHIPVAMDTFVRSRPIRNVFFNTHFQLGTDHNIQIINENTHIRWEHFSFQLPDRYVLSTGKDVNEVKSIARSTHDVFERSLKTITVDACDTVLELIAQNSIARGKEFKNTVVNFREHKIKYENLENYQKELYPWAYYKTGGRIRNSAIGTLLIDLSEDRDLTVAVKSFEEKVGVFNYKRPTALHTKAMVTNAEKYLQENGLIPALNRRHANLGDLPLDRVLFVDKSVRQMDMFKSLMDDVKPNLKSFDKIEEVSIDTFLSDILPTTTNLEILFENKHVNRLMTLVAPADSTAPSLFPWDNGLSWDYNGNVADSMKERVAAKGGKIDGELRFSIQWNDNGDNQVDLDAHCAEPTGNLIYYPKAKQKQHSSGMLDVDIINPGTRIAVENIVYTNRNKMPDGQYTMITHNYSSQTSNAGFSAEIEFDGIIHSFHYDKKLKGKEKIEVAKVEVDNNKNFKIIPSLQSGESSKEIWGLKSNYFQRIAVVTKSPNYWKDKGSGNHHIFFILDKAKNTDSVRGMFNEFLKPEHLKHRKVFEVMANKFKVPYSDNQLSGLGFSWTQHTDFICKVQGSFDRIIKVKI